MINHTKEGPEQKMSLSQVVEDQMRQQEAEAEEVHRKNYLYFNRENSHFLSKVSRVQICRVLKAVDFLLNDKAESSHLDFKNKILVSPVESSLPLPTLPELKQWLINLQSAFSKFLHEYDVL